MDNHSIQSSIPSTSSQFTEGPQNITGEKRSLSRIGEPVLKKSKFSHVDAVTKAINSLQEIANKVDFSQLANDVFEVFGKTVAIHLR